MDKVVVSSVSFCGFIFLSMTLVWLELASEFWLFLDSEFGFFGRFFFAWTGFLVLVFGCMSFLGLVFSGVFLGKGFFETDFLGLALAGVDFLGVALAGGFSVTVSSWL